MAKKIWAAKQLKFVRTKLSVEESRKRMEAFAKRKEKFIATVREGKDRGLSV